MSAKPLAPTRLTKVDRFILGIIEQGGAGVAFSCAVDPASAAH
jgi:hypothetical protein